MIIGIGVDIVDICSFTESFNKSKRFKQKVFTENEIAYCESRPNKYQHYAVRFAAKEALMKAIGTGWDKGVQWKQIEVKNDISGKPTLACSGKVLEILNNNNVCSSHLSLSHNETQAIAYVLFEKL
jgi:holo-[acyl-carrier protein] synthase